MNGEGEGERGAVSSTPGAAAAAPWDTSRDRKVPVPPALSSRAKADTADVQWPDVVPGPGREAASSSSPQGAGQGRGAAVTPRHGAFKGGESLVRPSGWLAPAGSCVVPRLVPGL